jgi:hypothetical protein
VVAEITERFVSLSSSSSGACVFIDLNNNNGGQEYSP